MAGNAGRGGNGFGEFEVKHIVLVGDARASLGKQCLSGGATEGEGDEVRDAVAIGVEIGRAGCNRKGAATPTAVASSREMVSQRRMLAKRGLGGN